MCAYQHGLFSGLKELEWEKDSQNLDQISFHHQYWHIGTSMMSLFWFSVLLWLLGQSLVPFYQYYPFILFHDVVAAFCADILLDDFLVAENSPFQSDVNSPLLTSERAPTHTGSKVNQTNLGYVTTPTPDGLHSPSFGSLRFYFMTLSLSLSLNQDIWFSFFPYVGNHFWQHGQKFYGET